MPVTSRVGMRLLLVIGGLLLLFSSGIRAAESGAEPAVETGGEETGEESKSRIRNLSAGNDAFGVNEGEVRTFLTTRYSYQPSASVTSRELALDGRIVLGIRDDLSGLIGFSLGRNTVEVEQDVPALGLSAGDEDTESGPGSVDLGLQYNWLSEYGLRPNVAVGLSLVVPTDRPVHPGNLSEATAGNGHYGLSASLDIAKNFYATSIYGSLNIDHRLPRDTDNGVEIEPGTQLSLRGNVAFSVNSYITLNGGWTAAWSEHSRVAGQPLESSDRDQFSIATGVTLRVADKTYVRQSLDFGVAGTNSAMLGFTLIHLQ